jgi:hypothetical protein
MDLMEAPKTIEGPVWPVVSPDSGVLWETATGLLVQQNGTAFFTAPAAQAAHFHREMFRDPHYYLVALGGGASETYISLITPSGEPEVNFSLPGYVRLGGMLSRSKVFANVTVDDLIHRELPSPFVAWLPAVVDLEAGTVHPITGPFLEPPLLNGRNQIVAVQQGPFACVINTEGTCLNIRAEPGAGQALDCAADGVLLRDLGETADVSGVAWLRVATPAGLEGWASTQYLER